MGTNPNDFRSPAAPARPVPIRTPAHKGENIVAYHDAPLGLTGPLGDNYFYSRLQVDAQGIYRLPKGFTAVVYGLNLTNEVFGFNNGSPI